MKPERFSLRDQISHSPEPRVKLGSKGSQLEASVVIRTIRGRNAISALMAVLQAYTIELYQALT